VLKSLLKVRLRCKFGDAEERAAFRYRSTAKSIAPCKLQPLKNLHVALPRDAMQRNATQYIFLVS